MTTIQESRQRARILEQFSRQAAPYAAVRGGTHDSATRLLLSATEVGADDTVLDVACGTGQLALAFAEAARCVTGIDITPAMIERAKALQADAKVENVRWQVGDAYRLPLADATFSVVTCRYALHHMLNPAGAVAEMTRVCTPGGQLALVDVFTCREKAAAFDRWERLRDPSHVRALTLDELVGLAKTNDLKDAKCDFYSFDIELEALLRASFSMAGDEEKLREQILQDLDRNQLGLGAHRRGIDIYLSYPIALVSARRA